MIDRRTSKGLDPRSGSRTWLSRQNVTIATVKDKYVVAKVSDKYSDKAYYLVVKAKDKEVILALRNNATVKDKCLVLKYRIMSARGSTKGKVKGKASYLVVKDKDKYFDFKDQYK